MFRNQLGSFSKVVIPRGTKDYSKPKVTYSGKAAGANDDLVMCFIIGIYWSVQFMTGQSNPSIKDIIR
jgi:hypothetical protein